MADETKECINCDAKIGKDEKVCPACTEDQELMEESVKTVEKVNAILAKRKAKEIPAPAPQPEKKISVFRKLALKKKEKK